ncbi:MAG TPA: hypothetical protein VJ986_10935, partial [Gaiellaceae bacterium]|nr:hypothetical protein [Gaiellaceae bacterium]
AQAVAAGTELAVARKQLAATRVQLRSATTVGARRNTVLLRTQTVLAQVDPLLSTADEIQRYTAHIQGERDWFTTSVVQLVTDLTVLGNYLLETDPAAVDPVRQRAFVEAVKDDLDSVRRDEATLHAFDKSYDGASTRFGRRADAFTKAVRALQQQLKSVAVK